jgi:hypothetical protein
MTSSRTTFAASDGPLFVSVMPYVIGAPAVPVGGAFFTTARSALEVTVVFDVELLLFGFTSSLPLEITAVFASTVPAGTFAPTSTFNVHVADAPPANDPYVQVTEPPVPTGGSVHAAGGPEFWTKERNVVPGGRTSVTLTDDAASAPRFAGMIVKASGSPAFTVAGAVFVTVGSAVVTVRSAEDDPFSAFGSAVLDDTVAVLVNVVPDGVPGGM